MEALNVDEVVGQLLASEGFTSVEELALVDVKELAVSKVSTTKPRPNCRTGPANIWNNSKANSKTNVRNSVWMML